MLKNTLLLIISICAFCAVGEPNGCNSPVRVKRQSDGTGAFIGIAIQQTAGTGVYRTLKRVSRTFQGRPRGKRATRKTQFGSTTVIRNTNKRVVNSQRVNGKLNNYEEVVSTTEFLSVTQTFKSISSNYQSANMLRNALVRTDSIFRRMIVVKSSGVRCQDVCSRPNNGYGTIGLCTNVYCRCWGRNGSQRLSCGNSRMVFDPERLRCANARDTVLCSDDGVRTASSQRPQTSRGKATSQKLRRVSSNRRKVIKTTTVTRVRNRG